MIKITSVDCERTIDPYHHDTGSLTKTVLSIDPRDDTVSISQEYDDNATPIDVWNGLVVERVLHNSLNKREARSYLESEDGQSLLQKIVDGWEENWNGNNYVGSINDDASTSLEELAETLDEDCYDDTGYWAVDDWFANSTDEELGITEKSTDDELKKLATELDENSGCYLIGDVEEYLRERRDNLVLRSED
jgi:hypothetical protein